MSVTTMHAPAAPGGGMLAAIYREGQSRQPVLWGFAVVMTALIAPTLAAFIIDGRELYGVDVWTKIIKFEVSLAVFFGTIAWFWEALKPEKRDGRVLKAFAYAAVGAASFEIAYMIIQAGRGVASHFNDATAVEAVLFQLMGLGAVVITSLA